MARSGGRPLVPAGKTLTRQLQLAVRRELAAQGKVDEARALLAQRLAQGRAEGLSVQALSEASGLSPKRVRNLVRGVESG